MSPRSKVQFEQIREESKQRILESALQLFANQGYAATSISSIAANAGISKGLIYNYFNGKEEIAKACTDYMINLFLQMMEILKQEIAPKEKLESLFNSYFQTIEEYGPEMMTLYIRFSMELAKYDFFREKFGNTIKQFIESLIPIFSDLGYKHPAHEAWELGILMDGIGLHLSSGFGKEYEKMVKEILAKKYNINLK